MQRGPARIARVVALVGLIALPSRARADECLFEANGVGLGMMLPSGGCAVTAHTDVALAMVTRDWRHFGLHGDVEGGLLAAIPGFEPLHLGAVIALGGDTIADESGDHSVFEAKLLMRGRLWFPPEEGVAYLDFAVGPTVLSPDSPGDSSRVGLYGELGLNLHGALGVFFGAEPTFAPEGGPVLPRFTLGAKTTAIGFLVALTVYLCVETRC